jgi:hypothetical protein
MTKKETKEISKAIPQEALDEEPDSSPYSKTTKVKKNKKESVDIEDLEESLD